MIQLSSNIQCRPDLGAPRCGPRRLPGSVGSGQKVAASAASTVKRVHLELGGKAPVVVFDDADLEAAAKGVRSGGFWNGGQECGSACRVLVHESVAAKFTELLVREVSGITVGTPGAGDVEIGSMISKAHYDRVLAALEDVRKDGLTIAVGGKPWRVRATSSNPPS